MRKFNIGDTLVVNPKPWRLSCFGVFSGEQVVVKGLASSTTLDHWVHLEGRYNRTAGDGSYPEFLFERLDSKEYDPKQQPYEDSDI